MAISNLIVLVFGIMCFNGFIGEAHLSDCPTYMKHELLRDELLSDRAICRAIQYEFTDSICMNGFKTRGYYCSTGDCNILGYNCDGHCLSGEDFLPGEYDFEFECDKEQEMKKLCAYYQIQFDEYKRKTLERNNANRRIVDIHVVPSEIAGTKKTGLWESAEYYFKKLRKVCPNVHYEN